MLQKTTSKQKTKKQTNKQKAAVWKNQGWFSIEKKILEFEKVSCNYFSN